MCHGGLDAKFIVADIEARVKPVAFERLKADEPRKAKQAGLWTRLVALTRKERKGRAPCLT